MTTEQIKYPPYVTSKQGQILFRFLSVLADHFDKNIFWIKSQFGLYKQKFGMIPNDYLVKTLKQISDRRIEMVADCCNGGTMGFWPS